jgi:hypothetical protein
MITLNLKRENFWLDLIDGVRVHVRPASTALVMAARVEALKEEAEPALRSTALIKRLAQLAIVEWDGVGGEDGKACLSRRRACLLSWICGPSPKPSSVFISAPRFCWNRKKTSDGSLPLALWRRAGLLRRMRGSGSSLCLRRSERRRRTLPVSAA